MHIASPDFGLNRRCRAYFDILTDEEIIAKLRGLGVEVTMN
jgi:hypothetical protein